MRSRGDSAAWAPSTHVSIVDQGWIGRVSVVLSRRSSTQSSWLRHGPDPVRYTVATVVVIAVPVLLLVGLVGAFAERVGGFETVLLAVINPIGILGAARSMLEPEFFARWGHLGLGAAAVALAANTIAAVFIGAGLSEGDIEVPIIFAVPFAVFCAYVLLLRLFRR